MDDMTKAALWFVAGLVSGVIVSAFGRYLV